LRSKAGSDKRATTQAGERQPKFMWLANNSRAIAFVDLQQGKFNDVGPLRSR
jgi:hypothetical protein